MPHKNRVSHVLFLYYIIRNFFPFRASQQFSSGCEEAARGGGRVVGGWGRPSPHTHPSSRNNIRQAKVYWNCPSIPSIQVSQFLYNFFLYLNSCFASSMLYSILCSVLHFDQHFHRLFSLTF